MRLIEEFKKESTTLKILDIAFIISLIYEILTFNGITICTTILGIIAIVRFYEWFSKKEEWQTKDCHGDHWQRKQRETYGRCLEQGGVET